MASYPIINNCNFESRDDAAARAIHAARKAVESGRCDNSAVMESLDHLESVLTDHADDGGVESVQICRRAEAAVVAAWEAANADLVYVVVDASGEYLTVDGGRTPAADEAREYETHEEAAAACVRATDRVRSWPAE